MTPTQFSVGGHEPDRASWECRRCGGRFPCDVAREALRAYLGPIPLAMLMWAALDAALLDLGEDAPSAGELFNQFIKWTRLDPLMQRPTPESDAWRGHEIVVTSLRRARQKRLSSDGAT